MSKTVVKRYAASLVLGVVLALTLVNVLQMTTRLYTGQPASEPTSKNISGELTSTNVSVSEECGKREASLITFDISSEEDVLAAGSFTFDSIAVGLAVGLIVYILARLLTR